MSREGEIEARRFRPEGLLVLLFLYLFLVSIKLMGGSFKDLGAGFTDVFQGTVANPVVGLAVGIFFTSFWQSSSFTTSLVVGLVASGQLPLPQAVPIVMGANIGTTITNTIVSIAHVTHRPEFRRAVATATLHDFFNVCCVIILFPIELATGYLRHAAGALTGLFVGVEAGEMPSPLGTLLRPTVSGIEGAVRKVLGVFGPVEARPAWVPAVVLIVVALVLLFASLTFLVKNLRRLMSARMERILDRYLFASTGRGLLVGLVLTALVQSSSVTTSLMVPLGAAGLLTAEQLFPYMMGANIGTTVTAILASLATDSPEALTIALVHLLFNLTGVVLMLLIAPLRRVPLFLARTMGEAVMRNRAIVLVYALLVFFVIPGVIILLGGLLGG